MSNPNAPAIELIALDKFYGDFHVLKNINLTVRRGEGGCLRPPPARASRR